VPLSPASGPLPASRDSVQLVSDPPGGVQVQEPSGWQKVPIAEHPNSPQVGILASIAAATHVPASVPASGLHAKPEGHSVAGYAHTSNPTGAGRHCPPAAMAHTVESAHPTMPLSPPEHPRRTAAAAMAKARVAVVVVLRGWFMVLARRG